MALKTSFTAGSTLSITMVSIASNAHVASWSEKTQIFCSAAGHIIFKSSQHFSPLLRW